MGWYDYLLHPFKWVLSWVLVGIHSGLTTIGFPSGPGATWIVTIAVMTVVVNLCILPLYIKQIKSARGMAVIQPKMNAIREKYKGRNDPVSRQQMQQETMNLYSEYGVNPMASCLPAIPQIPIMMSLYRLLWQVPQISAHPADALGAMTADVAKQIEGTSFFGVYLSETFTHYHDKTTTWTLIITLVVIYAGLMFAQMFLNYKFNTALNNPQQVRMMRIMAFTMPLMVGWFGFIVQLGLLIYLVITMAFNFVRQVVTIYLLPTPGARAHDRMLERHRIKYDAYKQEKLNEYQHQLNELGATAEHVSQAQKIIAKARVGHMGEINLDAVFADKEHGEKLLKAYQIHEATQASLHQKAQDLELEERPAKKKNKKPGIFARALQQAQEQQNLNMQVGQRDQSAQPKRTTRSKRTGGNNGNTPNKRNKQAKRNRP